MKADVTVYDFINSFNKVRPDNFSYDGLRALYDYLENECEPEFTLDVIALCCEFTEWENLEEFQDNYSGDYESLDDINNETTLIIIDDDRFITLDF